MPQNNSRSSVLILKRGESYKAYVMTIVGYPEYLNGDTSKLANNTYGKRDANFSGMVYYTTPQGEFVNGYTYKKGSIKGQLQDNYPVANTGSQAIQSLKPNLTQTYQVCTIWYQKVGEVWEYLDTQCHTEVVEVPDPSIPIPPATPPSSGGGGGDTPTNPDPDCPPQGEVQSVKDGKIINTIKIRLVNPGDGGFPPPAPDDPCTIKPVEDPCDKVKKQKQNLPADFNSKNTAILAVPGPHEFGSDLKLTSPILGTYKNTPITTSNQTGYWIPNFTWNSTDGYTIGSVHRHQVAGPSPDDIFSLIDGRKALSDMGASISDKQFFENNAYATILLNNTTFIVTINYWGTVQEMFSDYNQDRDGYSTNISVLTKEYQDINNVDELTATLAVLKDKFGDAITLSKAPAGSTRFAIVGIDQDGKLITIPCPQ